MDIGRSVKRGLTGLHARVFRLSRGKVGGSMGKAETVLLTTTGRRSGRSRTTPLVGVPDGDRILLVASNGGSTGHPDWYFNLEAQPEVTIQRKADALPYRARPADAAERAELWPRVVSIFSGYEGYQRKTEREIPVVVCEPR